MYVHATCVIESYHHMAKKHSTSNAYGCAIYGVQDSVSKLLFSKVKDAPLIQKTLPTLELLSAYLGIKCLESLMTGNLYKKVEIESVNLLLDNQCVLSWLLAGHANRKNVFVNNRLTDIALITSKLQKNNINVRFSYVPSNHNSADLLTRTNKIDYFVNE